MPGQMRFTTHAGTSSDKDHTSAAGADHNLVVQVAGLIPVERYRSLSLANRSLLADIVNRFLGDATFREDIPYLLHTLEFSRGHSAFEAFSFPFMKLPVELRLMIAKHALSYPAGLIWHWISEEPGKRVGTFKSMDTRNDYGPEFRDDPFTRLCLSRELRHEMPTILSGCPTLVFDGDDPEDRDTREFPFTIRAVEACEFFLSNATIGDLGHKPKIIIPTYGVSGAGTATLAKLSSPLERYPQIRVIEKMFGLGTTTVTCSELRLFCGNVIRGREMLEQRGYSTDVRNWRVHAPEKAHLHIEALRDILYEAEFNIAKDFIENGI